MASRRSHPSPLVSTFKDSDSVSSLSTLDEILLQQEKAEEARAKAAKNLQRLNAQKSPSAYKPKMKKQVSFSKNPWNGDDLLKKNDGYEDVHDSIEDSPPKILSYSGTDLLGQATAKRLSQSGCSNKDLLYPGNRRSWSFSASPNSIGEFTSSSSTSSQTTQIENSPLNQPPPPPPPPASAPSTPKVPMPKSCLNKSGIHSGDSSDKRSTLTGMSKWTYPRRPSFVVDINNPPKECAFQQKQNEPIYANVPKKKTTDANDKENKTKETDKKVASTPAKVDKVPAAANSVTNTTTEIYYPTRSPFRTMSQRMAEGRERSSSRRKFQTIVMALVALGVVVAVMLYFVMYAKVVEQNDTLERIADFLSSIGFNKTSKSNVIKCLVKKSSSDS